VNPILVAHGTGKAHGVTMIGDLAERVGHALGVRVRTAFVDVLGPTPAEVLRTVPGPVVLVPAFLAGGYHVRTDIPAHVAASRHPDFIVTDPLGPSAHRLRARGAHRVVVTSYLLADGLFQDRLRASGADVVTEPLGTHPGVVRLIASRFRRARLPLAA
jgi:sirohydrochlorin ferrochelatase